MKKQEAYNWNENTHSEFGGTIEDMRESTHYLIKKIYDDIEKINCINCKHWDKSCDYCTKLGLSIDIGGCMTYFEKAKNEY